jgi:hypothetical protein
MIRKSVIRFTITEICRRQTPLRTSHNPTPPLPTPRHEHFAYQISRQYFDDIRDCLGCLLHVAPDAFVRGRSGRRARFRMDWDWGSSAVWEEGSYQAMPSGVPQVPQFLLSALAAVGPSLTPVWIAKLRIAKLRIAK